MTNEKYRVEHNSVYEYDADARAYIFVGRLMNETLSEFIYDLAVARNNDEFDA